MRVLATPEFLQLGPCLPNPMLIHQALLQQFSLHIFRNRSQQSLGCFHSCQFLLDQKRFRWESHPTVHLYYHYLNTGICSLHDSTILAINSVLPKAVLQFSKQLLLMQHCLSDLLIFHNSPCCSELWCGVSTWVDVCG